MSKSLRSASVPKAIQLAYEAVTALTDEFCRGHLTEDYCDLARTMTAALSRKRPSPLSSGQARTWAFVVIHLLGQINFLSDKSSTPSMPMAQVCAAFGVAQSTASAKARSIQEALDAHRLDPRWMFPSLIEQNPLVWMAELNGLVVDLRDMLRAVQVVAYDRGMIPYVPQSETRSAAL